MIIIMIIYNTNNNNNDIDNNNNNSVTGKQYACEGYGCEICFWPFLSPITI